MNDFIIKETVTEEEKYFVALGMKEQGGNFVKCIGEALQHADKVNSVKIKRTFNYYWKEHLIIGKKLHEEEQKNE